MSAPDPRPAALCPAALCPVCGKPREVRFRPFCSKRCADIDLSRWLKGVYAVPGREEDDASPSPAPER